MKFIPTRVHGMLDYAMGLLLIASPWLFDFADGGAAQWIPIILGAGAIVYSLMTDYELGAVRRIPMKGHLALDAMSGGLLAISPWLFGFYDEVGFWPHVILGMLEFGAANLTHTVPDDRRVGATYGSPATVGATTPTTTSDLR